MLACLLLGALLTPSVLSHSWLTCTDYLESNGHYFDHKLCRAYPRHANKYAPNGGLFGRDTGYNHQPSENNACKTRRDDSSYDQNHPMAVYYPGQVVVLAHPTKNHVADVDCTNKYIPDNGNKLYVSGAGVTSDLTLSQYYKNEVWDWGVAPTGYQISDQRTRTYPKPGFQNAPRFCENPDKALGTYTWTVPKTMKQGRYSFMWAWWFNSKDIGDLYTGCFEAEVVADKAARDRILQQRGQTTSLVVDVNKGGVVEPITNRPATNAPVTNNPGITAQPGTRGPPVKGGWGQWSPFEACSKQCGGGIQRRVRHCNNPFPANGGASCQGKDEESRPCNQHPCAASGVSISFTSDWGSGANAEIRVPNPRTGNTFEVQLPCAPASVQVWHADDVTSSSQRQSGLLVLRQSSWQLDKDTIGMTLHFGGCRIRANNISIRVR